MDMRFSLFSLVSLSPSLSLSLSLSPLSLSSVSLLSCFSLFFVSVEYDLPPFVVVQSSYMVGVVG